MLSPWSQEVIINALLLTNAQAPGLLVPCCVALLTDTGVVKLSQDDQGLWTSDFFLVYEERNIPCSLMSRLHHHSFLENKWNEKFAKCTGFMIVFIYLFSKNAMHDQLDFWAREVPVPQNMTLEQICRIISGICASDSEPSNQCFEGNSEYSSP